MESPPEKYEFNEDKLLSPKQEKLKIEMIRQREKEGRRPIDSVDEFLEFVFKPGWEW